MKNVLWSRAEEHFVGDADPVVYYTFFENVDTQREDGIYGEDEYIVVVGNKTNEELLNLLRTYDHNFNHYKAGGPPYVEEENEWDPTVESPWLDRMTKDVDLDPETWAFIEE